MEHVMILRLSGNVTTKAFVSQKKILCSVSWNTEAGFHHPLP